MRAIIFRGKRVDNGEWVEGHTVLISSSDADRAYIISSGTEFDMLVDEYENIGEMQGLILRIISETLGQYTGLTDKNDKKIFEGDIIKVPDCCHRGDAVGFVYYDCDETAYCAKCWGIKYQLGADLSSDSIEIIGNIHDNPELLEV